VLIATTMMTLYLHISHAVIQNFFLAKAYEIGVVLMPRFDIDWSPCAYTILPNVSSYAQIMNNAILRRCFDSEHASLSSSMPIYVEVALYPCRDAMLCATLISFEYQLVWDTLVSTAWKVLDFTAAPVYHITYLSSYFVIANNSPPKTR